MVKINDIESFYMKNQPNNNENIEINSLNQMASRLSSQNLIFNLNFFDGVPILSFGLIVLILIVLRRNKYSFSVLLLMSSLLFHFNYLYLIIIYISCYFYYNFYLFNQTKINFQLKEEEIDGKAEGKEEGNKQFFTSILEFKTKNKENSFDFLLIGSRNSISLLIVMTLLLKAGKKCCLLDPTQGPTQGPSERTNQPSKGSDQTSNEKINSSIDCSPLTCFHPERINVIF